MSLELSDLHNLTTRLLHGKTLHRGALRGGRARRRRGVAGEGRQVALMRNWAHPGYDGGRNRGRGGTSKRRQRRSDNASAAARNPMGRKVVLGNVRHRRSHDVLGKRLRGVHGLRLQAEGGAQRGSGNGDRGGTGTRRRSTTWLL
jgi:hypothetical protein